MQCLRSWLVAAIAVFSYTTYNAEAAFVYGVSLNGANIGAPGPSSLYSIDTITGAGTLIGDIGYAVNSLAVHPTTGVIYGSTTTWSPTNGGFNGLLTINPTTGAGAEVGVFGGVFTSILGLSFNASGQLYGWHDPAEDDLVSISLATGAATTVGNSGISTIAHVMDFDSGGNLVLVQGTTMFSVNTTTGAASFAGSLSFGPGSAGADFDSAGLLWAPRSQPSVGDSWIRISNLAGNSFVDLDTDVRTLSALAFPVGTTQVPEPGSLALLALGLTALACSCRRKQRAA